MAEAPTFSGLSRHLREELRRAAVGNTLDRAIDWLAPVHGARRHRARMFMALSGGYASAGRKGRRETKGWNPGSADADTALMDRLDLIDQSHDLHRNSPIARGAVNTATTSTVGAGLTLSCAIDRDLLGLSEDEGDAWEAGTEREFRLWAESTESDALGVHDFFEAQEIVARSQFLSGDCFAFLPMIARRGFPYETRVQIIEGERVCNRGHVSNTPRLIDGVVKDERGAPVAVHVARSHPNALLHGRVLEWDEVDIYDQSGRRNVLHIYKALRPDQTRGEPWLAPVMIPLKQLTRYSEAELMAAVVAGMFTVFVESAGGGVVDPLEGFDQAAGGGRGGSDDEQLNLGNGIVVGLDPGEKISSANPGRPNATYEPFVNAILQEIGVALEIPYELLVKHFTASYSASQAALLEAWRFFKARRIWLGRRFCQPVYEAWLAEAVAIGRISAPGFFSDPLMMKAWSGAVWNGPAKGQIREDIETEAAVGRIEAGLSTIGMEATAINGADADRVHRIRAKEKARRVRDGLEPGAAAPAAPGQLPPPARERNGEPDEDDASAA